ncbi:MAG TPA: glycoside hydrolase family 20 zincin-like fold domain-containing protein [Ignavibacteriales bacterium]|nr:glycoside hydrolase family 20 zincin-like fold domain-containing protein [Ignavibacteriales bacterium]
MKAFLFLLTVLMTLAVSTYAQSEDITVVPYPRIVNRQAGAFRLLPKIKIILSGENASKNRFAAELLKQSLSEVNVEASISEGLPEKGSIVLLEYAPGTGLVSKSPYELNAEGYQLLVTKDGISIKSTSDKGVFYGVMTLNQLLESSKDNSLPGLEIMDWPDMKMRGISDDISRGQVQNLDEFKRVIRFLARYKMNIYMPYIEDVLRFDQYPTIGVNRGALTKEEVKELVAYAKNYFIDIIPAFQTLGHYENILSQPEFLKYAEFPGAASLNVSSDSTYIFLNNLLKEVTELFPSEYFNMGADESYDVGLGKSRSLVEKSSMAQVHLQHYLKVYKILKGYGKKVMMYGDIILRHPEILQGLPKDITVIDWHYGPGESYPSTEVFAKAGHPYLVSPSVWNFTSDFPVNENAIPNIRYMTQSGLENGAIGMINSNWGDYGAETFKELNDYGYAWSAQCAWNYKASDEAKFSHDFLTGFYGTNDLGILNVYETLNSPLNQLIWHEVWRHPLLPFRDAAWWEAKVSPVVKMSWMETTLPKAKSTIFDLKASVRRNEDQLDLLNFVIKLDEWYQTKLKAQFMLQDKLAGKEVDLKSLNDLIDENVSTLKKLESEYNSLWLKYNKKDNLNMIDDKFNRLVSYFEETKRDLAKGTLRPPQIPSEWIYCRTDDTTFAKSARFTKTFSLSEKPSSAFLQFLGDTYAKLFINGQLVDQVYTKRAGSLLVDYKRIKFLDVTKYLKEGDNSISVEAENFQPKGFAGFNLMAEIKTGQGTTEILSDQSWKAESFEKGAQALGSAVKRDYPFIVTAPDFETKRPSWIER